MTAILILAAVAAPFVCVFVGAALFALADRLDCAWLGFVAALLFLAGSPALFAVAWAAGEVRRR